MTKDNLEPFFNLIFSLDLFIICTSVLLMCVSVYHVHPGNRVMAMWVPGNEPGPLQEQVLNH